MNVQGKCYYVQTSQALGTGKLSAIKFHEMFIKIYLLQYSYFLWLFMFDKLQQFRRVERT